MHKTIFDMDLLDPLLNKYREYIIVLAEMNLLWGKMSEILSRIREKSSQFFYGFH